MDKKEPAKEPQPFTTKTESPTDHSKPLEFQVESYAVKIVLEKQKLNIRAYSKLCSRMFEGLLEDQSLKQADKIVFDDCEGVFAMIEECLQEKRTIMLNDIGELKFPYFLNSTKKSRTEKLFCVNLKQVEVGQSKQLLIKIDKLEAQNATLRQEKLKQDERIRQLEQRIIELEVAKPPKFEQIIPQLDLTTTSIGKVTASNIHVQCNRRLDEWHSYFLTRKLEGCQSFQIEIIHPGDHSIFVGVAAESLKNTPASYGHPDSLALGLFVQHTYLYRDGQLCSVPLWVPEKGSRIAVTVDRVSQTVEWRFTYPVCFGAFKVSIPTPLREKVLLPVLHLNCCSESIVKIV